MSILLFPPETWDIIAEWLDGLDVARLCLTGGRTLSAKLLRLQNFHLKWDGAYPLRWPAKFLSQMPLLSSLSVTNDPMVSHFPVLDAQLPFGHKDLRKLSLRFSNANSLLFPSDSEAMPLKMHFPMLTHLTLDNMKKITLQLLSSLPATLIYLHLRGGSDLKLKQAVEALPPDVEHLDLAFTTNYTEEEGLITWPKNLKYLNTLSTLRTPVAFYTLPESMTFLDCMVLGSTEPPDISRLPRGLTFLDYRISTRHVFDFASLPHSLRTLTTSIIHGTPTSNFLCLPPDLTSFRISMTSDVTDPDAWGQLPRTLRFLGLPHSNRPISRPDLLPRTLTRLELPGTDITESIAANLPRTLEHLSCESIESAVAYGNLPQTMKVFHATLNSFRPENFGVLPRGLTELDISIPVSIKSGCQYLQHLPPNLKLFDISCPKSFWKLPEELRTYDDGAGASPVDSSSSTASPHPARAYKHIRNYEKCLMSCCATLKSLRISGVGDKRYHAGPSIMNWLCAHLPHLTNLCVLNFNDMMLRETAELTYLEHDYFARLPQIHSLYLPSSVRLTAQHFKHLPPRLRRLTFRTSGGNIDKPLLTDEFAKYLPRTLVTLELGKCTKITDACFPDLPKYFSTFLITPGLSLENTRLVMNKVGKDLEDS